LEDPGVDGRIILKWILEKWVRGTDWINLAQDRDRWRSLMYVVMTLRVLLNAENFMSFSFSGRILLCGVSK
jgi:hypothetical protein